MMLKNIDRVSANNAMLDLDVATAGARGDPKKLGEHLKSRMGLIILEEARLDRSALKALKDKI